MREDENTDMNMQVSAAAFVGVVAEPGSLAKFFIQIVLSRRQERLNAFPAIGILKTPSHFKNFI